jgi:hypothetical protein
MLCVTLKSYTKPCGGVSGGVSRIWVFDPTDFNFTQVAKNDPYTVIALRDGATAAAGAKIFPINFQRKEAEFKFKHTITGCSVKYEFDISAQLPGLTNDLTAYLMSLDTAGCCCGLGLIIELNTGVVLVIGERYVNASLIPYFEVKMDGTDGTSGKKFEDFQGANVMFKGEYNRPAFEYTGGINSLIAFQ